MTVTGTPTLTLTIGAAYKTASYTSGSGSKKLVFEYTVATEDEDTNGVSIAANQLTLPNGAKIQDSNGNNTALTHAAVAGSTSHKVDAKDPTVANNGVSITSTGAPYSVGEKIQATVTFSENVVVTNTPQLTLKVGTSDKKADYASGTGTTKLVFEYKVKSGDTDTDGIEIEANKLALNNGTIADAAGNVAVLDHAALSTQNAHKVDGTAPSIVTDGVSISSGAGTDDTYKTGDKIEATVRFSENVTVTGTPQLTLKIGTADKKSLYTSGVNGGGTTDLVFEYTVAAGDADTDGIEVKANKLALNSGTITDTAGNTATLTHTALATQAKHKVDGVAPTVEKSEITSTPGTGGFYKTGDDIQATVTFSEEITVTGTPQVTLAIGSDDRKADYKSGDGTTKLLFEYTVAAGDEDTDGISIVSNSLSGTLKDAAGNAAALAHAGVSEQGARGTFTAQSTQGGGVAQGAQGAGAAQGAQGAFGAEANFGIQSEPLVSGQSVQTTHKVDGVAPTISSVAITSTPTNSTYVSGNTITVTVTFSETVNVTNTPRLALTVGTADKHAGYTSGSATTKLKFQYTVQSNDSDTNGVSIAADKLELNGGTIKDIAGNAATLTYTALSDQSGHKVNSHQSGQQDNTKPTVTSLSITSTGAPYGVGETIQVTVQFSETVVVNGTPQLTLTIGNSDVTADYASGSSSTALVFAYTVKSGDSSGTKGISIPANSLAVPNSSTIKDNANNDATRTHTALGNQASHKVDTAKPTVSSVTITSYPRNNGTYKTDETIQATATFDENVVVTGTPQLTLTIGSTNRKANYTSGSGTKKLVFEYTVQSGDVDTDGISIPANGLAFNGGTIKDAAGNNATLTHSAISAQAVQEARGAVGAGIAMAMGATAQATQTSHKVDGVVPTITSNGISITSTPSSGDTYGLGETIEVTVTFNEKVYVEGNPYLILEVGIADRQANWMRGNDSKTLVFQYTVVSGDTDTNGVSVGGNSLKTNGGTIRDATYNDANLTHNGIQSGHKVLAAANGSLPPGSSPTQSTATISSVALTSTGPYGVWDNIQVRVTTTTPVTVTGSPTLGVIIGNTEKRASYQRGSGTTTLDFQYTVAAGDGDDPNGISVKANSLNGGSITDTANNALNPNYPALPDQGTQHRVDTTAPQVSSITFSSIGPYGIGSYISVTATTSEPVTVTGQQPTLTLVIGSAERRAYLFSRAAMSTSTLVFGYRITAVDKDDKDGISVKGSSLALNGGVIADNAGNMLNLSHSGLSNGGDTQTVGVTVSGINSVAFTSTGPYTVNDAIQVTVSTAEQINVIGAPRIAITVGSDTKYADYVSGSGTTALVFQYTVVAGDTDTDGVEIPQNALENYNSSRMNNSYGTHLVLNHPSVPAAANHIVDTAHPEITEVDFATEGPKVYTAGTTLEVVVTFQETGVQVTPSPSGDMPTLQLLFGSNVASNSQKTALEARYTGTRAGSTKLIFSYTITSDTPIDTDGAQIEARSLWMPSATSITDANGNAVESIPSGDGSVTVNIRPSSRVISRPILPAITANGIIFNEFLNADIDKEDWVELRNISGSEVSFSGWKLNLTTNGARSTDILDLPDTILPAGEVMLLMNAAHTETRLERSDAYTYRYLILPQLHLRGSDFSLILRDRAGTIVDAISNHSTNAGTPSAATAFVQNEAYVRAQPSIPGYDTTAWQPSGYQGGIGYDRKATKDVSLGTPGYLQSILTQKSPVAPVSISEVMFTGGTSENLPQWVELYNESKTEVVTLYGWRFQVEMYDSSSPTTHGFVNLIIQKPLRILPNQTVLIVTKAGRNSQHFPEHRVYNLTEHNANKIEQFGPTAQLLKTTGYAVVLRDESGNQVDIVGNMDGDSSTRDVPTWKLYNCITPNGNRTSIIRQYEKGTALDGVLRSNWFRATSIHRRAIVTYYGHPMDIGNPGWKKGGPLPVQLSSFSAKRTEQGALIKWTTESELENAGFNVLRSDTRTGTFKVINPRMLEGAGTTSERSTYTYVDTTAKAAVAYYYRLEEVSYAGVRQPVATSRLRGHVSAANRYLTTFGSIKKME